MPDLFLGKNILVTGATGLIGSELVRALIHNGACVTVYGRNEDKIKKVFGNLILSPQFCFCVGDISRDKLEFDKCFDYIFHAAGPISGKDISTNPVNVIRANVTGTEKCLEYIRIQRDERQHDCRLILFSSATIYGVESDSQRIVDEKETNFGEALDAKAAAYSESKRMVEVLANAYYKQFSINVVKVRIGYVYGYSKIMPETAFYEFIKFIMNNKDIEIHASAMPKRDNIYVTDAVNGLLTAAVSGSNGEAYNISSGGELGNYVSASEMAVMLVDYAKKNMGYSGKVVFEKGSCDDLPGVILRNQKLKNIGWNLETDMKSGLAKILDKYRKDMMI